MKILCILFATLLTLTSCNKETPTTQIKVMNRMLTNKNWYLDYSIIGNSTKSYLGQSTYFVTYLNDGTTKDSDGLIGVYSLELVNNQSQIHVQVNTVNGNSMEIIYNIISVGDTKLVLSKLTTEGSTTELYFTNK